MKKEDITTYINCICACQIVVECMDELEDTEVYKGKLKSIAGQLEIQITKSINPSLETIFSASFDTAIEITKSMEEIMKSISTMGQVEIYELSQKLKNKTKL